MKNWKTSTVARAALALLAASCGGVTDENGATQGGADADLALRASDLAAAPAGGGGELRVPVLDWQACADGFECARARVPRDYARPAGRTIELAVTRLPARNGAERIGSLFVNFGGPGGDAVASLHDFGRDLFATLNERFDIVGFDPRGTGETEGAFDCRVNQEQLGLFAQPIATPETDLRFLRKRAQDYIDACLEQGVDLLPYASTADAARDMDLLRAAVGDRQLSYLGFSYGTFLGATYASLFPTRYRALVLDGALDAEQYLDHPSAGWRVQTAAFETALDRFFQACAVDQAACRGFGGADPWGAFDQLVARADRQPLPTSDPDARVVDGADLLMAAFQATYAKQIWPFLAEALAAAEQGDGSIALQLVDYFYGRNPDGSYEPFGDRFFLLIAGEQRYSREIDDYVLAEEESWASFPHFWVNTGISELPMALFPVHAKNAYYGPFRAAQRAPGVLVVGTTYDPATPYRGSVRLVQQLGNARLLSMQGDGHTAYGGNSTCIDAAVEAYLERGVLPEPDSVCQQEVPFSAPPPELAESAEGAEGGAALRGAVRHLSRFLHR